MLARLLAKLASVLPSSLKYQVSGAKRLYTLLMRTGGRTVMVTTAAGAFRWAIDENTSQRYILGTYEPEMQKNSFSLVEPGFVVYDVGAHAGFHSLIYGLLVGATGQVLVFEPNPRNRVTIERQRRANPGMQLVSLPFALSDRCGPVEFDVSRGSAQGGIAPGGGLLVEARTVDSLVHRREIPPPDFIKLDVEGHEAAVLRGALDTFARNRPTLLCDFNEGPTAASVRQLLEPLGYWVTEDRVILAVHPSRRTPSNPGG